MISRSHQSDSISISAAIAFIFRGNEAWIRKHEINEHTDLVVVWLCKQDDESFTGNLTYTKALVVAG